MRSNTIEGGFKGKSYLMENVFRLATCHVPTRIPDGWMAIEEE
jgi:hypothetical protein